MIATAGHLYRLGIALSAGAPADSSWLAGPLTATYPADVVSIASPAPLLATAILRWRGEDTAIELGSRITTNVPGLVDLEGVAPEATIASVDDLGATATPVAPSSVWTMIAAVGILATVIVLTRRVRPIERRAA